MRFKSRAAARASLIDTVTVSRDPSRLGGVTVEISGRLNALLGEKAFPNQVKGVWGKMVAGERYMGKPTTVEALFSYRRAA